MQQRDLLSAIASSSDASDVSRVICVFTSCHLVTYYISREYPFSTSRHLDFQSNTMKYLLCLIHMFWSLFGQSSGCCMELFKSSSKFVHEIYVCCIKVCGFLSSIIVWSGTNILGLLVCPIIRVSDVVQRMNEIK